MGCGFSSGREEERQDSDTTLYVLAPKAFPALPPPPPPPLSLVKAHPCESLPAPSSHDGDALAVPSPSATLLYCRAIRKALYAPFLAKRQETAPTSWADPPAPNYRPSTPSAISCSQAIHEPIYAPFLTESPEDLVAANNPPSNEQQGTTSPTSSQIAAANDLPSNGQQGTTSPSSLEIAAANDLPLYGQQGTTSPTPLEIAAANDLPLYGQQGTTSPTPLEIAAAHDLPSDGEQGSTSPTSLEIRCLAAAAANKLPSIRVGQQETASTSPADPPAANNLPSIGQQEATSISPEDPPAANHRPSIGQQETASISPEDPPAANHRPSAPPATSCCRAIRKAVCAPFVAKPQEPASTSPADPPAANRRPSAPPARAVYARFLARRRQKRDLVDPTSPSSLDLAAANNLSVADHEETTSPSSTDLQTIASAAVHVRPVREEHKCKSHKVAPRWAHRPEEMLVWHTPRGVAKSKAEDYLSMAMVSNDIISL